MTKLRSNVHNQLSLKKTSATWLFLVLLTLPHTDPAYLNRFPVWETILDFWKLASFAVIAFWVLILRRKTTPIVLLVGAWEIFLFTTTFIHQGELYNAATSAFSVLSIVLLYDVAYREGETFLSSQLFCFEVIIYINLITEIVYPRTLFPNGMYLNETFPRGPNWFLGYYNGYTKYCIPALMFAWLYKEKTGHKLRSYLLLAGIVLSAILVFAGGFALAIISMLVVYVFLKNRTRIFNYFSYWALHIIFFFAVNVLQIQNLFMWLVDGILGKLSSFETRMLLWEKTMRFISDSPYIGHGILSSVNRIAEYQLSYGIHAHNMLLELLYQGGFIGLALWSALVVFAGINLYKNRNTNESKIISTAFLGWCITTLVEPFTTPFFMGMFVIAYHSNRSDAHYGLLPGSQTGKRIMQ